MEDGSARPGGWAPRGRAAAGESGAAGEPWCRIVRHPDGYTVRFGGGPEARLRACQEDLQGAVPPRRRRFDPATRTWWVEPALEDVLSVLSRWAGRHFAPERVERAAEAQGCAADWRARADAGDGAAEGWVAPPPPPAQAGRPGPGQWQGRGGRAPAPPAPRDALAEAYAALWLRPGAPPYLVRAAYRALAARHHPDVGGDESTMKRLNAAYAALQAAGNAAA